MTFDAIKAQGADALLAQVWDELTGRTYQPLPARKQRIPKDRAKSAFYRFRIEGVQGALKLILEPVFEADRQHHSKGALSRGRKREAEEQAIGRSRGGRTPRFKVEPKPNLNAD